MNIKVLLIAIAFFYINSITAQTATLTITVENLNPVKGNIQVGLYNKAEGFAKEKYGIDGAVVAVTGSTVSYTFKNLPAANYAMALYHDANSDDKMNTNLVGFPKESYGFSNNAFGTFGGIPDFSDAMVTLADGEKKEIVVKLK